MPQPTSAESDDNRACFGFPAIAGKKFSAGFDGGRLTSDGGVLLLGQAERQMGIAKRLAACIADPRDQSRVIHGKADILRARMLAIACGYEDANDLDALRHDPGFKLALGKCPEGPVGLASQPTMCRWENAPTTRELVRLTGALVDIYCASYPAPPAAVTLDIDDTVDVVHGAQQLSFWNGITVSGAFCRSTFTIRRISRHWPDTAIMLRGDGHYGRPEIMAWCEANGVDYIFGLLGNRALHADPVIVTQGDACATDRAVRKLVELRRYAETRYAAKSWGKATRRVVARIEASTLGLDIRFVVTSLQDGSAERIYDTLYCARGQAENLIKLHKAQLKSDRTSCRSANANQMRLILHTAAYWLMWKLRHAMPATAALRTAEFATIRLRLIKLAARVIETATRNRVAFASACPEADTFRQIARALCPAPT